jgi:hypothetical protein
VIFFYPGGLGKMGIVDQVLVYFGDVKKSVTFVRGQDFPRLQGKFFVQRNESAIFFDHNNNFYLQNCFLKRGQLFFLNDDSGPLGAKILEVILEENCRFPKSQQVECSNVGRRRFDEKMSVFWTLLTKKVGHFIIEQFHLFVIYSIVLKRGQNNQCHKVFWRPPI